MKINNMKKIILFALFLVMTFVCSAQNNYQKREREKAFYEFNMKLKHHVHKKHYYKHYYYERFKENGVWYHYSY